MNTIKQRDVQNKKAKVFISFVLDESGSMQGGKNEIVSGMNEQIQTLKKKFEGEMVEPVVSLSNLLIISFRFMRAGQLAICQNLSQRDIIQMVLQLCMMR